MAHQWHDDLRLIHRYHAARLCQCRRVDCIWFHGRSLLQHPNHPPYSADGQRCPASGPGAHYDAVPASMQQGLWTQSCRRKVLSLYWQVNHTGNEHEIEIYSALSAQMASRHCCCADTDRSVCLRMRATFEIRRLRVTAQAWIYNASWPCRRNRSTELCYLCPQGAVSHLDVRRPPDRLPQHNSRCYRYRR